MWPCHICGCSGADIPKAILAGKFLFGGTVAGGNRERQSLHVVRIHWNWQLLI